MIRRVAHACAPKGARVDVNVDRFTEFDLVVAFNSLETRRVLADCARCVLGACSPYVNSLQFVYDTNVLAGLDRRQIDGLTNWQTASLEDVVQAFAAADYQRARRTSTTASSATNQNANAGVPAAWDVTSFYQSHQPRNSAAGRAEGFPDDIPLPNTISSCCNGSMPSCSKCYPRKAPLPPNR